jgi:hypothetical protein
VGSIPIARSKFIPHKINTLQNLRAAAYLPCIFHAARRHQ